MIKGVLLLEEIDLFSKRNPTAMMSVISTLVIYDKSISVEIDSISFLLGAIDNMQSYFNVELGTCNCGIFSKICYKFGEIGE